MIQLLMILSWCLLIGGVVVMFHKLATLLGVSILLTYLLLPLVDGLTWLYGWVFGHKIAWSPKARPHVPRALVSASLPHLTPRLLALVTVYALIGIALVIGFTVVLPILQTQARELLLAVPRYLLQIRAMILTWNPSVHLTALPFDEASWPRWLARYTGTAISMNASSALPHLGDWLSNSIQVLVYTISAASLVFYLLLDGPQRSAWLLRLMPDDRARDLLQQCHQVLLKFVRGQVLLAGISGLLMWFLYTVFGVPHALLLSFAFTIAEIFPVIGPWFAFTPGMVVMLLGPNPWVTVYVLGIYFLLKDNIILPKVVGEVMGMHPVWIILAILFAAHLGGAVGVIFAVPVAALIQVWFNHQLKSRSLLLK